jgi:uncharacterized membrane protein
MSIVLNFVFFIALVLLYLRVKSISERVAVLQTHQAKMIRELNETKAVPEPNQTVQKASESVSISMNPGAALTIPDDQPRPAPPPPGVPSIEDLARVASQSSQPRGGATADRIRSNADWEMLIGGNLFAKLGALAIVISAGFALNYAFVNDLISEGMRIALGFVGGAAIIAGAFQARKKDLPILGQVLVAAGISILYLTVYAMSQFYRMVPDSVGIGLMLGVSALTVVLALAFRSQPVAMMAAAGAWLTPLLLGSDTATAIPLLVYMLIVSLAMASLVWYKPDWIYVRVSPLIGVLMLTLIWYTDNNVEFFALEAIFIYMIWVLYLMYDLYHHVVDPSRSSYVDAIVSALNSLFVLFVTIQFFDDAPLWQSTSAVGFIAVVYAAMSLSTRDRVKPRSAIAAGWNVMFGIFALWAVFGLDEMYYEVIIMTVIALAVFLVMERLQYRQAAWAFGIILLVTTLALLLMGNDTPEPDFLIANNRTLAYVVVILLWLTMGLKSTVISLFSAKALRDIGGIIAILLGFMWLNIELETGFDRAMPLVPGEWDPNRDNWIELTRSAAWLVYSLLLFALGVIRSAPAARYASIILFGFSILKIFLRDLSFLDTPYRIGSFLILGVILLLVSFVYQRYRTFIFGVPEPVVEDAPETKPEEFRMPE